MPRHRSGLRNATPEDCQAVDELDFHIKVITDVKVFKTEVFKIKRATLVKYVRLVLWKKEIIWL